MDLAAAWADARVFEIVKAKWDSLPPPADKKDQKKGGAKKGGAKRPGSSSPAKVGQYCHTQLLHSTITHLPGCSLISFLIACLFTHKHTPS